MERSPTELGFAKGAIVAVACAVVLGALALPSQAGAAPVPRSAPVRASVDLWGDSLAYQDGPFVAAALRQDDPSISVRIRAFPGTGLCNWLHDIRQTATQDPPTVVILQFLGAGLTTCAGPGANADLRRMARMKMTYHRVITRLLAAGVSTVEIVPAPTPGYFLAATNDQLKSVFASIAASFATPKVTFVDAGVAVEGPDETFAAYLPCLPSELVTPGRCHGPVVDGQREIRVRASDLVHFCNVPWSTPWPPLGCPRFIDDAWTQSKYSSGAYRMAEAMVAPIRAQFGLPVRWPETSSSG